MPDNSKRKLYVGCGLTHAPVEFRDQVEFLKRALGQDWVIMDFLGLTDGAAIDVYRRDIIENVGGCDAFVAIADEPSIGLGYEIAIAVEQLHKPVLVVAHVDTKLTRMIHGATSMHPNMAFVTYSDMVIDVPRLVNTHFRQS